MRLALTDPLTGLGNYRHFHERLQLELASAEEDGTRLTLCLVDVDDFKRVNDRFGHPAGDRVLSSVAGLLRQGGEAFRLGGDEFAVLLPGLDERAALTAAESIAGRIGSLEDDEVDNVRVSVGVASVPVQGAGRDELVRLADSALYWAKEHGKNQVRVYRPDVVDLAQLRRLAPGPDRRRPLSGCRKPGEGGRRTRRVHGQPLRAGQRARGQDRGAARARRRADRADTPRDEPPRPRQARDPRRDPPQAGHADRGRATRARTASADRLPDAREPRRRPRRRLGTSPSRALGRDRLSGPPPGRGDPARRPNHLRRRRLRRDDVRPRLPAAADRRGRDGGADQLRRHTVRPIDRRRIRRGVRRRHESTPSPPSVDLEPHNSADETPGGTP